MLYTKFNGDVEAYRAFMKAVASKGGKNVPKEKRNFYINPEAAAKYGAIGGAKSKRGKKSGD